MCESEGPAEVIDTIYPIVLHALHEIKNGNGAKPKDIFCFIRKQHDVALADGDLNCAIRGALKKGVCLKAVKKSLFGKYKLKYHCDKLKKGCPPPQPKPSAKKPCCPTSSTKSPCPKPNKPKNKCPKC